MVGKPDILLSTNDLALILFKIDDPLLVLFAPPATQCLIVLLKPKLVTPCTSVVLSCTSTLFLNTSILFFNTSPLLFKTSPLCFKTLQQSTQFKVVVTYVLAISTCGRPTYELPPASKP